MDPKTIRNYFQKLFNIEEKDPIPYTLSSHLKSIKGPGKDGNPYIIEIKNGINEGIEECIKKIRNKKLETGESINSIFYGYSFILTIEETLKDEIKNVFRVNEEEIDKEFMPDISIKFNDLFEEIKPKKEEIKELISEIVKNTNEILQEDSSVICNPLTNIGCLHGIQEEFKKIIPKDILSEQEIQTFISSLFFKDEFFIPQNISFLGNYLFSEIAFCESQTNKLWEYLSKDKPSECIISTLPIFSSKYFIIHLPIIIFNKFFKDWNNLAARFDSSYHLSTKDYKGNFEKLLMIFKSLKYLEKDSFIKHLKGFNEFLQSIRENLLKDPRLESELTLLIQLDTFLRNAEMKMLELEITEYDEGKFRNLFEMNENGIIDNNGQKWKKIQYFLEMLFSVINCQKKHNQPILPIFTKNMKEATCYRVFKYSIYSSYPCLGLEEFEKCFFERFLPNQLLPVKDPDTQQDFRREIVTLFQNSILSIFSDDDPKTEPIRKKGCHLNSDLTLSKNNSKPVNDVFSSIFFLRNIHSDTLHLDHIYEFDYEGNWETPFIHPSLWDCFKTIFTHSIPNIRSAHKLPSNNIQPLDNDIKFVLNDSLASCEITAKGKTVSINGDLIQISTILYIKDNGGKITLEQLKEKVKNQCFSNQLCKEIIRSISREKPKEGPPKYPCLRDKAISQCYFSEEFFTKGTVNTIFLSPLTEFEGINLIAKSKSQESTEKLKKDIYDQTKGILELKKRIEYIDLIDFLIEQNPDSTIKEIYGVLNDTISKMEKQLLVNIENETIVYQK